MNKKFDNLLETTPYVVFDLRSEIEVPGFPSFVFQGMHTKMQLSFIESIVGKLFIFSNGEIFIEIWLDTGDYFVHELYVDLCQKNCCFLESIQALVKEQNLKCRLDLSSSCKPQLRVFIPIINGIHKNFILENWWLTLEHSKVEEIISYLQPT
jgi:hypothetical protein